jgi:tripartite-type tricarboxylate transporter receptor subunit TctC
MTTNRRPCLRTFFYAAVSVVTFAATASAEFPDRPVTLVVGYPPGGPSDVMARLIQPELSKRLGQPVVIENKPGANGMIAAKVVAQAPPDGYMLNVAGLANITNALLNPNAGVKLSDLTWVALIGRNYSAMLIPAKSEIRTLPQFIEYARKNPGKLNCGSGGIGSSPHFNCELFKAATGTDIVHVAYKGMAPALTDLMGDRIQVLFNTVLQSKSYVEDGTLRALAVSSPVRSKALPTIPTLREQNVDVGVTIWTGVTAAPGTPQPIVDKLNAAFRDALATPEVAAKMDGIGVEIDNLTAAQFQAYAKSEEVFWADLIKKTKLAAE